MKRIELTNNEFSIVDDDDYMKINSLKWRLGKWGKGKYAVRSNGRKELSMHRFIMNPAEGFDVDHINGDGLDNRKINLRICTRSENLRNQRKKISILGKKPTSGFKGVSLCLDQKRKKKWAAQITLKDKVFFLGRFETEREAAIAYNQKASLLFGEFARPNEI